MVFDERMREAESRKRKQRRRRRRGGNGSLETKKEVLQRLSARPAMRYGDHAVLFEKMVVARGVLHFHSGTLWSIITLPSKYESSAKTDVDLARASQEPVRSGSMPSHLHGHGVA